MLPAAARSFKIKWYDGNDNYNVRFDKRFLNNFFYNPVSKGRIYHHCLLNIKHYIILEGKVTIIMS